MLSIILKKTKGISANKLLLILSIIFVLPFFILSFYAVPNLEDYAESIIPNVWWHIKFLYLTYDGRFFSSFLFAVANPLKFESYFTYKLIPIFIIISLFIAFNKLCFAFITSNKKFTFLISALVLMLFLNRNPNIPYSLYYLISYYVYLVPGIFFLFLVASGYRLINNKKKSIFRVIFICLAIFAVAGGNELLLIPDLAWFIFLIYFNQKNNLKKGKELTLFAFTIICAYFIVLSSPGTHNSIDENVIDNLLIYNFSALWKSIKFTNELVISWLSGNYLLYISSIIFIGLAVANKSLYKLSISKKQALALVLFLMISVYFIVLPYTWAAGDIATASYTQAFIIPYLFFTLFWFYSLFILSTFINTHSFKLNSFVTYSLVVLLGISIFFDNNSNIKTAYQELFSGKAKLYHDEVMRNIKKSEKNNLYLNNKGELELCELNHKSKTLFSGVYFNKNNEDFHLQYRLFYRIKKLKIVSCP